MADANTPKIDPMLAIAQALGPKKQAPMGEHMSQMIMERAQQSPLFEAQRGYIDETKAQLDALKNQPKKRDLTALAALTDIFNNTGGTYSKLYQTMKPKDTAKTQLELQKLLRQQQQGLTDDQLKFMKNQMMNIGPGGVGGLDYEIKKARLKTIQDKSAKEDAAKETQSTSVKNIGQILIRDINMAKDIIDKEGNAATTFGGPLGLIPGTEARTLRDHLDSIKGNVAVDQLLNIKRQGSGLGQVPQSQLDMLSTLMGSLKPDLQSHILRQNLKDIEDQYAKIVRLNGGDPLKLYRKRNKKGGLKKATKKAGPEVGTVKDGFRFKGGDPRDKNSWEKM